MKDPHSKMKVAVMFSGGKDSTFAIDYCLERKWQIEYLLSVKPTRTDCFLFHFATVEHTPLLAEQMGIRHILTSCSVADPEKEAEIVRRMVEAETKVDAVVLGGVGLQETQLRSIQNALLPLGIEVFAAHAGEEHDKVMLQMLEKGYTFMITQIASDGLGEKDLGTVLTIENIQQFFAKSKKFRFHVGGEGGYYDTLTLDGPIFKNRLEALSSRPNMECECAGHLIVEKLAVIPKLTVRQNEIKN